MSHPEYRLYDLPLIPRREAWRIVMAPLAALCAASPGSAAEAAVQEKAAAARVEKKVNEAKLKAKQEKHESKAFAEFKKELAEYSALHNKELSKLGSMDKAAVPKALATALIDKRHEARQGDVFIAEVQPLLKARIAEQLKGPDTQAARLHRGPDSLRRPPSAPPGCRAL